MTRLYFCTGVKELNMLGYYEEMVGYCICGNCLIIEDIKNSGTLDCVG